MLGVLSVNVKKVFEFSCLCINKFDIAFGCSGVRKEESI